MLHPAPKIITLRDFFLGFFEFLSDTGTCGEHIAHDLVGPRVSDVYAAVDCLIKYF